MVTPRRRNWLLLAVFVTVGLSSSAASAQVFSPYTFGGTLGWPYGFYQDEHVPYFSLHPPVYYSRPVPRTYGWSPWAYPPGVLTPDVACQPEIVDNPHVEGSSQRKGGVTRPKAGLDRNASYRVPKVIDNPYVETQVAAE
jgi:hypothetical protein